MFNRAYHRLAWHHNMKIYNSTYSNIVCGYLKLRNKWNFPICGSDERCTLYLVFPNHHPRP